VVPSAPWNERGLGCIAELQLGAAALAGPADVLRFLEERRLYAIRFDADRAGEGRARVDPSEAGQVAASEPSPTGEARAPAATRTSSASERQAPRLLPERHVAVRRGKRTSRGNASDRSETSRARPPATEADARRGRSRRSAGDELDARLAAALLEAIAGGAHYIEQIAATVGADPLQVNHAVLLLMLRGELERGPCGEVTIPGR
jgi:hypothetical protein